MIFKEEGRIITCKAAVAWGPGQPLVVEEVLVDPPKALEIRIKVVCTSLCRSDITQWESKAHTALFPRIFGHEASGVVESVGEGVTDFVQGDHVLTLFTGECMKCRHCISGKSNMCQTLGLERNGVMHGDKTTRFSIKGKPVYHYCAVSSFSEYTVVHSGCAVKIASNAPMEKICLLSCGVAAGLGAAWKVADVSKGSTVVIFGLGTVGLSVVFVMEENMEVNQVGKAYVSSSQNIESKKKPRKYTSVVWDHFTKDKDEDGHELHTCKCNHCKKSYECNSAHGTTTLRRHLEMQCPKNPLSSKDKNQQLLAFASIEGGDSMFLSNWKFDQEVCRKTMARMIIVDELPFNFVEKSGFRAFCKALQPRFNGFSRTTMTKDCFEIYKIERLKLEKVFRDSIHRVCLTTDVWTSIQNMGYMCLTAHYIDTNWKLQKKIINFCLLPSPHTGDIIAQSLDLCLKSWGIQKICTITVDNASSNDVAVKYLEKRMAKRNALLGSGEYLHVRCAAHIINLIVRDGIDEIKDSIHRIRNSVKYVKSSPSRQQKFNQCVTQEEIECKGGLSLDVPTRWNSTYLMLESALKFQKAFDLLIDKDNSFKFHDPPNEDDWENARVICKFLETFYYITNRMSGSLYVTSNIYFVEVCKIERLLHNLMESTDSNLRKMSGRMKDKFDKYWGNIEKMNILLIIAVVLDPRYKLAYVEFSYTLTHGKEKAAEIVIKVKNTLFELYKIYEAELGETESKKDGNNDETNIVMGGGDLGEDPLFEEHMEWSQSNSKTEFDKYLEDVRVGKASGFDILGWWSTNTKYIVLSQLARDILAIPVSTVASESAFSTGGRVLDSFRSSLTPRTVETLVCAQDWLRSSSQFINVAENLVEIELAVTTDGKHSIDLLKQLV